MAIIIRKLSRPGCRPCAAISHYLAEIAPQIAEEGATVTEHDVMVERGLLEKYEITGVPVLVFERSGVEVARLTGLVSPEEILDTLIYAKEVR
ncbi:thioredoxin family protein [Robertmurraya andreesenii]|uniref:Thioredoxin 1 n=1 Tax=Anoxybacillus andreesenii TaxID=1325932 RepID=A0ABT9V1X5_9BACL|nr:thioredoxin family protein [Robertmurraya andreesenii]MDQ0154958.1 thioredoxin 1 [Robertmurraya andreesenii]